MVSFRLSPEPSILFTIPAPYLGCITRSLTRKAEPLSSLLRAPVEADEDEEEEEAEDDEEDAEETTDPPRLKALLDVDGDPAEEALRRPKLPLEPAPAALPIPIEPARPLGAPYP